MAVPIFVKVSPYAARKLKLDTVRFKTADGNYLLRRSDMLVFGPLSFVADYAARIGGVILLDAQAAANQRGDLNTPLPTPTDPEWIDPEAMEEEAVDELEREIEEITGDEAGSLDEVPGMTEGGASWQM